MIETVTGAAAAFWEAAFGPGSRLWPLYLIATLGLGFAIYRFRGETAPFLSWLMPRAVWTHASHIVDLKLFALTKVLSVLGVFNIVLVAAFVTSLMTGLFPADGLGGGAPSPLLVAALLLIVGDFATYWVHRVHHEARVLWPFHSVHHSAEVMTPVTVFRKHPFYDLSKVVVHGTFLGVLQGVLLALFPGGVSMAMLMGVNAGYFVFNMLGSNFRHSHVWLSYGRVLEHVLISPAQHQIHHSLAPEHHNKNYGEVLAIWDWMFGTLYVPEREEQIEFGLGDKHGNRLSQRHGSLTAALVVPIQDSWRQLRKALQRRDSDRRPITPAE